MRQHAGEYLSFQLGGEQYGIDILKVQEIRGYEAPTRIANAPSFILGVLNLRGVIVPIWDMRIKLRMDARLRQPHLTNHRLPIERLRLPRHTQG